MFQDSLVESGGRFRTSRGWTTVVSVVLQLLVVGLLVLLPLLNTEALPRQVFRELLTAPGPPLPAPARVPEEMLRRAMTVVSSERVDDVLRAPREIPKGWKRIIEDTAPELVIDGARVAGSVGGPAGSRSDGVLASVLSSSGRPVVPTVRPAQRVVVSTGVSQGMLIRRVEPVYPRTAIAARIQGTVVLQAVIGRDGSIQNLRVVSGNPLLAPAALEAAQQWRYRLYLLNGQPVEVETQVAVIFKLS